MTAARMTTDEAPRSGWARIMDHGRSVRARIVLALVVVTVLCLAGAGTVAYLLEAGRVDRSANGVIAQEMHNFDVLMAAGVDPRTGLRLGSAVKAMRVSMTRNATTENEVIVAFANGRAIAQQGSVGFELYENPAFLAVVRKLYDTGGTRRIETPQGEAIVAVKPVSSPGQNGAYVVSFFVDHEAASFNTAMKMYALIALALAIIVASLAWFAAGRLLRPIRLLRETAQEISESDLSRRINVASRDDLGDLARTFNAMLARLEASFADQRRFLDDAGHELRTPITIVRGHLELTNPADAADVEATKALAIDELDRMSRLVDDLMVLAKAERPDFVKLEPIDAGALTDNVLDKVSALGDRSWVLDVRAEGQLLADPQRITQALVQLAKNAVAHTGPGDEIGLGSWATSSEVGWTVRDAGTGIPEHDAHRIFDRFTRGDNPQDADGSGLGLSIVRAIVRAHGGEAYLLNGHGQAGPRGRTGATFVITIPRRIAPTVVTRSGSAAGTERMEVP